MIATALNLLIALALSMGIDVDSDWLPDASGDCVQQMSGSSSAGSTDTCQSKNVRRKHQDAPPEIYNGF